MTNYELFFGTPEKLLDVQLVKSYSNVWIKLIDRFTPKLHVLDVDPCYFEKWLNKNADESDFTWCEKSGFIPKESEN